MSSYYNPPTHCQMCEALIKEEFFDCSVYDVTVGRNRWGNICKVCFKDYHCKLGTGLGQHYKWDKQRKGFYKVAG